MGSHPSGAETGSDWLRVTQYGRSRLACSWDSNRSPVPPLDTVLQPHRASVCPKLACSFTALLPSSCSHALPLFPHLHSLSHLPKPAEKLPPPGSLP